MKNFSEFDKSFNISKISSYKLSIEIGYFGYSYCITDTIRKQVVALSHKNFESKINDKNLLSQIEKAIKRDVYLNKNYKSVDFIYNTSKFTLVPTEFFNKKLLKSFFKFGNILHNYEELHFNKLKNIDAYNIFAIPSNITTFLVNKFPEISFQHQATPLINYYIEKNKESKSLAPTVVLNVAKDKIEILVTKAKKLLFYNIFEYRTENDIIYYLLNTIDKLDIDTNKLELILSGNIEGRQSLHLNLQKYISEVRFAVTNKDFNYNINNVPEHFLSNIINS